MNPGPDAGAEPMGAGHDGSGRVELALPAALDSFACTDLMLRMRDCLAAGRSLTVEAGDVALMTTAAAQLFVSAGLSFEAKGLSILYRGPSDPFIEAFSDLGLYSYLAERLDADGGR